MKLTDGQVARILLKHGRVCPQCKGALSLTYGELTEDIILICPKLKCHYGEVVKWVSSSRKIQKT